MTTVDRKAAVAAVARVGKAVQSRPGIPVLAGVRLRLEAGELELEGTDLELSVRTVIRTEPNGSEAWECIVPWRVLRDALKASSSASISIMPGRVLEEVSAYGGTFAVAELLVGATSIRTLPLADWPNPTFPEPCSAMDAAAYRAAATVVLPACSRDEYRPVLTGMLHSLEAGTLTLVGTDSYRLHVAEVADAGADAAGIVPARAVKVLAGIIGARGSGPLEYRIGDTTAVYYVDGTAVAVRLIDGEYPNWRALVPEESDQLATFQPAPMLEAIAAAAVTVSDTTPIRLEVDAGEPVRITSESPDVGRTVLEVAGSTFHGDVGDGLATAYNPGYLRDAVRAVSADRLELRDGLKPAVARGPGGFALVMPVRLPAAVS